MKRIIAKLLFVATAAALAVNVVHAQQNQETLIRNATVLTVTRGTDSSPSFDSCANFTPDATNYVGAGNGVVYSGPLSSFPASYAAGIVDPTSGSPETWSQSEAHSYRFVVTLQDDNAAQGLTGNALFTWEARYT